MAFFVEFSNPQVFNIERFRVMNAKVPSVVTTDQYPKSAISIGCKVRRPYAKPLVSKFMLDQIIQGNGSGDPDSQNGPPGFL